MNIVRGDTVNSAGLTLNKGYSFVMTSISTISKIAAAMLIVALAATGTARAQDATFRIGVVDLEAVFENYDKQKERYAELVKEKDKLQAPLSKLADEIEANKKRYNDEQEKMSEADRNALRDKVESDYSTYKAEMQRSQEEIDRQEKRIVEELIKDIQIAVEEVGAKEKYHLIFDGAKNAKNNLLYYDTTMNMTSKVVAHLNTK